MQMDFKEIVKRFHSEYKTIVKNCLVSAIRLKSYRRATTKGLQCNYEMVSGLEKRDCKATSVRLRNEYDAIAMRK
jgi:hypothetical protein